MGIHYNKGADLLDYLKNPEVFKQGWVYRSPEITRLGLRSTKKRLANGMARA